MSIKPVVAVAVVAGFAAILSSQTAGLSREWPTYGHDPGGMRFSPLTEITPENVGKLKVAWTYHMRPDGYVAPGGRGAAAARPAPTVRRQPEPRRCRDGDRGARRRQRGRGGGGREARRLRLPPEQCHAACDQRPDVPVDAVLPRRGASTRPPVKRSGPSSFPAGRPSTRGVEYWPGDGADAAADRVRFG